MAQKRPVDEVSEAALVVPNFPGPGASLYSGKKYVIRDNSECIRQLGEQCMFLRPTQMGKSALLELAYFIYDKKKTCPGPDEIKFQPPDKNTRFVFSVSLLLADGNTAASIDDNVLYCLKQSVHSFLQSHPELKSFYEGSSKEAPLDTAGKCLQAVARAVSDFGIQAGEQQSLLVLVDEYDKPVRELLIDFIGMGEEQRWRDIKSEMPNYRSFFSTCKQIVEKRELNFQGSKDVRVWITGVLPVALNVISDYNPHPYTFTEEFADAIGLCDEDVDDYLDTIHRYLPFQDNQRALVRDAVKNLANRLYFTDPNVPMYHTRMVNGLMGVLTHQSSRTKWLGNLSQIPGGIQFQKVPQSVFEIVSRQGHPEIRQVALMLSLDEDIESILNEALELGDILRDKVTASDYLTLLVHLGIASVRKMSDGKTIFKATSTFFRIPFFKKMLKNSLQPLFDATSLKDLYEIGVEQVTQFMLTLPKSGMSSLIRWANSKRSNHILELQFQAYLIEALADSLWHKNVNTTQEDQTGSGERTDVRIAGDNTIILLELKQKPTNKGPSVGEIEKHHKQLHGYMVDLVNEEKAKTRRPRRVAGFLVVMYNNGLSFEVQKTTYKDI